MEVQIYRARLASAGVLRIAQSRVRCDDDAAKVIHAMTADACGERIIVVYLNARNDVLGTECVASGGIAGASVRPAELFRGAIIACASAIILGHNHPSGDPTPSADDVEMTRAAVGAGRLLGIDVVDHVIVTRGGDVVSMRARGLL